MVSNNLSLFTLNSTPQSRFHKNNRKMFLLKIICIPPRIVPKSAKIFRSMNLWEMTGWKTIWLEKVTPCQDIRIVSIQNCAFFWNGLIKPHTSLQHKIASSLFIRMSATNMQLDGNDCIFALKWSVVCVQLNGRCQHDKREMQTNR